MKRPVESVILWVRGAVALLLLVDAVLLAYVWQYGAEHPETGSAYLKRLQDDDRRLATDVRSAQAIREQLPDVRKQCDTFLGDTLLLASTGYSSIVADLGKITADAGLPPGGVAFKQKPADKQGVIEVEVSATVEGNYSALVKFINGLERSKNLYLIDSLSFNSGREREAHLSLVMRTYFRS